MRMQSPLTAIDEECVAVIIIVLLFLKLIPINYDFFHEIASSTADAAFITHRIISLLVQK